MYAHTYTHMHRHANTHVFMFIYNIYTYILYVLFIVFMLGKHVFEQNRTFVSLSCIWFHNLLKMFVPMKVYLAMEAGYMEKVDELCERYHLDCFAKVISGMQNMFWSLNKSSRKI